MVESGVPCLGLASQQWQYIMHASQTIAGKDACVTEDKTLASGSCYCPFTLGVLLPSLRKFKICKLVTQHPLSGSGGISMGDWGFDWESLNRQFQGFMVCECVFVFVAVCVRVERQIMHGILKPICSSTN